MIKHLATQSGAQQDWCDWLRRTLPEELAGHVVNVVPKALAGSAGGIELVVLADSAAWGARLRFALSALGTDIATRDAAVRHTRVRVAPGQDARAVGALE